MNAGLPGLGIGGVFFLLAALFAPVLEVRRMIRGESNGEQWRQVGRQFAIAASIVAVIALLMPLIAVAATVAVLAFVLAAAKALELVLRRRARKPLIYSRRGYVLRETDLGRAAFELEGSER